MTPRKRFAVTQEVIESPGKPRFETTHRLHRHAQLATIFCSGPASGQTTNGSNASRSSRARIISSMRSAPLTCPVWL